MVAKTSRKLWEDHQTHVHMRGSTRTEGDFVQVYCGELGQCAARLRGFVVAV